MHGMIDPIEFEISKQTIGIMEDMASNAQYINDLRTELARDIYYECKYAWYWLAKIIEVRSFANNT